jgi:hypothetical protein
VNSACSNLFALSPNTPSDTHDTLRCMRCVRPESCDGDDDAGMPPGHGEAAEVECGVDVGDGGDAVAPGLALTTPCRPVESRAADVGLECDSKSRKKKARRAVLDDSEDENGGGGDAAHDVIVLDGDSGDDCPPVAEERAADVGDDGDVVVAPVAAEVEAAAPAAAEKKTRGRKRNRKSEEEEAYERAIRESRMKKLPDVPTGTMRPQIGCVVRLVCVVRAEVCARYKCVHVCVFPRHPPL